MTVTPESLAADAEQQAREQSTLRRIDRLEKQVLILGTAIGICSKMNLELAEVIGQFLSQSGVSIAHIKDEICKMDEANNGQK